MRSSWIVSYVGSLLGIDICYLLTPYGCINLDINLDTLNQPLNRSIQKTSTSTTTSALDLAPASLLPTYVPTYVLPTSSPRLHPAYHPSPRAPLSNDSGSAPDIRPACSLAARLLRSLDGSSRCATRPVPPVRRFTSIWVVVSSCRGVYIYMLVN